MSFTSLILKSSEYLAPFVTLTSLSAKLTDVPLGSFTQFMIRNFVSTFNIDLTECNDPEFSHYKTFNEFFIRTLKPECRPVATTDRAVCPVDGTVGEAGDIMAGRLIQAKGIDYSLRELLGGDPKDCAAYEEGQFACLYLSPANYHRIHMPLDAKLIKTIHVPGKLFPVGQKNISYMPNLYTLNERLVCFFESSIGPFALVMVGAALVGSINTVWGGTAVRRRGLEILSYQDKDLSYKRGEEIGHFKYGSTVICVWPKSLGKIKAEMACGYKVKFGIPLIE